MMTGENILKHNIWFYIHDWLSFSPTVSSLGIINKSNGKLSIGEHILSITQKVNTASIRQNIRAYN